MQLVEAIDRFLKAGVPIAKRRALAPIERKLEAGMKRAFAMQERAFMRRFARVETLLPSETMTEALRDSDWMPLFNAAALETIEAIVGPIDDAVRAALLAGGKRAMTQFLVRAEFELSNPRAVSFLRNYGANLVKGINETTRGYIKTVVTEGVEQGWSYDRMAKAITERYEEFRVGRPQEHIDSRAHLIAVQESSMAYESGNMIVAQDLKDAGLDMEKSWLVTGGNICDLCLGNEAEGWIPLDQTFSDGSDSAPGHVACKCTTLYRRKGVGD